MRPRALAVALGWRTPRNETAEAIASDLAAFLRSQGVKATKKRNDGAVVVTFEAVAAEPSPTTFTASAFPSTYRAEVMGANIIVEQVAGPATREMAPDLPIWTQNNGRPT